jgi:hypothetical protein
VAHGGFGLRGGFLYIDDFALTRVGFLDFGVLDDFPYSRGRVPSSGFSDWPAQ